MTTVRTAPAWLGSAPNDSTSARVASCKQATAANTNSMQTVMRGFRLMPISLVVLGVQQPCPRTTQFLFGDDPGGPPLPPGGGGANRMAKPPGPGNGIP